MTTKKCVSCLPTNKKVASTKKKRADWKTQRGLKTIFPNDKIPKLSGLKLEVPKNANQNIEINLGKAKAGRMVLYYASQSYPVDKCSGCRVSNGGTAYGNFKNRGIGKLDNQGKAILKICCPRPYREEGKTYPAHIHFIIANSKNTEWENKLFTQTIVCEINYQDVKKIVKTGCALLINALPFEYYVKNRIPGSVPLDHNLVLTKLNKKEVIEYIRIMLRHCVKINKSVVKGKLDLMDIPIVVYCYNESCEADLDLQIKLNKIGFTNVKVYQEGIVGWKKKN